MKNPLPSSSPQIREASKPVGYQLPVLVPRRLYLAAALAALAAACGGGSDDLTPAVTAFPPPSPPPPAPSPPPACAAPPEGLQPATTSRFAIGGLIQGRTDPSFILLTVPSGSLASIGPYTRLLVYGPDLAASAAITGFVYAWDGLWCDGTWTYNGWDTGTGGQYWSATDGVYLRTTVDSNPAVLSGSIRSKSTNTTYMLTGGPLPGAAAGYSVDEMARLADVEGRWDVESPDGNSYALLVAGDGALTVTTPGGWTFAGELTPNADIGVFDLRLGGGAGGVLAYPLASGEWQMLMWWWIDDGWGGELSVGTGRR